MSSPRKWGMRVTASSDRLAIAKPWKTPFCADAHVLQLFRFRLTCQHYRKESGRRCDVSRISATEYDRGPEQNNPPGAVPPPVDCIRGSRPSAPERDSGARAPLHLGRRDGRHLGGCHPAPTRIHEDTRTPSRMCRTGWIPAPAHTRRAILVTLGVAPAAVKSTPQQQHVRERVQRSAIIVRTDGFESFAFDP